MARIKLTKDEQSAINKLKRLSKSWPKSLWLFSASGTLCVMLAGKDGGPVMDSQGCVDADYHVDTIYIKNDGGDW